MKGKSLLRGAGVVVVTVAIGVGIKLAETPPPKEIVFTPEVVTVEPTDEVLTPVVITQEVTEELLTPVVITIEPTEEVLTPVVITAEPTEVNEPHGACMAIAMGSTCIEYWGKYWTPQTMAFHCSDGRVTYVPEPCPTKGRVGGCRREEGRSKEFIMWVYDVGGAPFTGDLLGEFLEGCAITGGDPIP